MYTTLGAVVLVAFLSLHQAEASAGRAFPIDSENYITEKFTRINHRLEWDHTNFLVDLAGQYANCEHLDRTGSIRVDRTTPDGESITGFVDNTDGSGTDINAVNGYLRTLIDEWARSRRYNGMIQAADRFGCSVRPGCRGKMVASCLFSPGRPSEEQKEGQHALAFTRQQYFVAETYTGNRWDRSHLLENLSGYETDCAMIGNDDWQFTRVLAKEAETGMRLTGVYGWTENNGSTDVALNRILQNFKQIQDARELGCSIIPDCMSGGQMYVVISCVYEE